MHKHSSLVCAQVNEVLVFVGASSLVCAQVNVSEEVLVFVGASSLVCVQVNVSEGFVGAAVVLQYRTVSNAQICLLALVG